MKKALIFQGGWDGHEPQLTSVRFSKMLTKNGYAVDIIDNLEPLANLEYVLEYDLLVSCFTMSEMSNEISDVLSKAIGMGVGLAGCHGGMCDSFRNNTEWQFITGGQWVSHPGGDGIKYTVNIHHGSSAIVDGIDDFTVETEHYYLHVDPSIEVLASTQFPLVPYYHSANKPIAMPVTWTKYWGSGRVFYTSLGHHDDVFEKYPEAAAMMERGMLWAAEGKKLAKGVDWNG